MAETHSEYNSLPITGDGAEIWDIKAPKRNLITILIIYIAKVHEAVPKIAHSIDGVLASEKPLPFFSNTCSNRDNARNLNIGFV